MRPGQNARIYVETYGRRYEGRVLSICGRERGRLQRAAARERDRQLREDGPAHRGEDHLRQGQDPQHLLRPGMSGEPDVRVE
jgi:membrane fusion protein (multidrug efflux system)